MTENKKAVSNTIVECKPTLCFGTFFLLICQSRNNLGTGKRNQHDAATREVSEAEVFNALMRIVYGNNTYSVSSHGEGTYKQCRKNKKIPCQQEAAVLKDFNERYDNCDKYIEIINDVNVKLLSLLDPEKDEMLVKSIIALLITAVYDSSKTVQISESVEFRISPTDKKNKYQLQNDNLTISLPHFLMDVYRYILNNCQDNTVGQATYENWCPKVQGTEKNTQRPLKGGPDISVIKCAPKVFRENVDLQAPSELVTAFLPEKKETASMVMQNNTSQTDSSHSTITRDKIDSDTTVKGFVIQPDEKCSASGSASNFLINRNDRVLTHTGDDKTMSQSIEELQKKIRLYEELGITDCTEGLKGTSLVPLKCMPFVHKSLYFMGVGGEKWVNDIQLRRDFQNMLRRTKAVGGGVRFLLINPASDAYNNLFQLRGESVPYDSYDHFAALVKKFDNLEVHLYNHMPSFRMQFVDDRYLAVSRYYFDRSSHEHWDGGWKIPHLIIYNEQQEFGGEIKYKGSLFGSFLLAYNSIWQNGIDIKQWDNEGKIFNK